MNRAQVVFVRNGKSFEPRVVRIGLSDYEYAEVIDGVKEGEMVALLGVAEAQAKRTQTQAQFRQRVGGGMPGAPTNVRVGGGGGGGGGGGRSTGGGR
jgi:translation elongation factor EF-G